MRPFSVCLCGAALVWLAACGSMSSTATAPSPAPAVTPTAQAPSPVPPSTSAPTPAVGLLGGTWVGRGSDSFSPELVRLVITQGDQSVSGTADLDAVDATDGSCGSCHKVKRGTLSGSVSGNSVTLQLRFPPGGNVPTPICDTSLLATATVASGRLPRTYTGTDSCEGTYTNGVLELTRQ